MSDGCIYECVVISLRAGLQNCAPIITLSRSAGMWASESRLSMYRSAMSRRM